MLLAKPDRIYVWMSRQCAEGSLFHFCWKEASYKKNELEVSSSRWDSCSTYHNGYVYIYLLIYL